MKNIMKTLAVASVAGILSGCATVKFNVDSSKGYLVGESEQKVFTWFGMMGGETDQVFVKTTADHYNFEKWEDTGSYIDPIDNPHIVTNVTNDRVLRAIFKRKSYTTPARTIAPVTSPSEVIGYQKPRAIVAPTIITHEPVTQPKVNPYVHNPEPKKVENLQYFSKSSPRRIMIAVEYFSDKPELNEISRAVEGAIANAGYEITKDNPFLTLTLKNKLTKFDKFGNFYIYKGYSELSVRRNSENFSAVNTVLARTKISAKGDRKLGQDDAISSFTDKVSEKASEWVKDLCKREMGALESVRISFNKNLLRDYHGTGDAFQNWENTILNQAKRKTGVLSCKMVSSNVDSFVFEFVYRKKDYPAGLDRGFINSLF